MMSTLALVGVSISLLMLYVMASETDGSAAVDSTLLWKEYRYQLASFIARGRPETLKTLQLLPQAIEAEWDGDDRIFQNICLNPPRFGATWEFQSGPNFYDSYKKFVYSLKRPLAPSSSRYRTMLDSLYDAEFPLLDDIDQEEGNCMAKFDRYVLAHPKAQYNTYRQQYCFTLQDLEADLRHLKSRMAIYGNRAYGGSKNFEAARSLTALLNHGDNPRKFIELTPLADFNANNRAGRLNSMGFGLEHTTANGRGSSKFSSFSLSFGFSFFSIGVGSSKSSMKMSTTKEDFKMEFKARSWAAIKVRPSSKWFSGELLHDWQSGPFTSTTVNKDHYFGAHGRSILPLLPKTIYVVYQPSITLSLNKEDAEQMSSSKSFGLKLSIGPVSFSFDKSTKIEKTEQKDGLYRFRVSSNSPTPQIIAVDNVRLPF